mmetsp:Transcript_30630/g.99582  ORF Transcript_30630/g.99582 Transcript_30630/m.99582 type:complete len:202 (+) Transcript_30630:266-871(+)
MVPTREDAANDAGAHLLELCELGRRVPVVQPQFELLAHHLREALARSPVGGLPKRDGGAAGVEAAQALRPPRLEHDRGGGLGASDGGGDEEGARPHDGDLGDASAGASEQTARRRREPRPQERVVDGLLREEQDCAFARGLNHLCARAAPEAANAAFADDAAERLKGSFGAVPAHTCLPDLEGHSERCRLDALEHRAERQS